MAEDTGQILQDLKCLAKGRRFHQSWVLVKSVRQGSNLIQCALQKGQRGRSSEGRTCGCQEAINLLPEDVRAELAPKKTRRFSLD